MREFEFIQKIRAGLAGEGAKKGIIGDDCAVLDFPCSGKILLSTDEMIEGVHFDMEYFSWDDVGYRAVSAACSDIAAMGGKTRWILIALGLPRGFEEKNFTALYRGITSFARCNGKIVGGNIATSPAGVHITTTVVGVAQRPIFRSGARPGDGIYITGTLGGSLAGMIMLRRRLGEKLSYLERQMLSVRHRRPKSRTKEGSLLGEFDIHAMIDISDGFWADLKHILEESGVGAQVQLEKIPLYYGVESVAQIVDENPFILAAKSGEEYELLFTADEETALKAKKHLFEEFHTPITRIGTITDGGISITLNGEPVDPADLAGWEH